MNQESEHNIRLTDFDYMLAEPHLQMMKAAIPYMQPSQQRMISMMIKFQELQRTRALFRQGEVSAMGLSFSGTQNASPAEMLQAIKPYATPRERDMIETLENLQLMLQTMQASV